MSGSKFNWKAVPSFILMLIFAPILWWFLNVVSIAGCVSDCVTGHNDAQNMGVIGRIIIGAFGASLILFMTFVWFFV